MFEKVKTNCLFQNLYLMIIKYKMNTDIWQVKLNLFKYPESKDSGNNMDQTFIRHKSVWSMSNLCWSKSFYYLGTSKSTMRK